MALLKDLVIDDTFIKNLRRVISHTETLSKGFDYEKGFYGLVFRQKNPMIDQKLLYSFDGDYAQWNVDDYDITNYFAALNSVISQRIESNIKISELRDHGRILCFVTCLTTHDGIAIAESQCFVDESDVPPIDTWFHIQEKYVDEKRPVLFCWIPAGFVSVMQHAINVEMMQSYFWLDEVEEGTYSKICEAISK